MNLLRMSITVITDSLEKCSEIHTYFKNLCKTQGLPFQLIIALSLPTARNLCNPSFIVNGFSIYNLNTFREREREKSYSRNIYF